MRGVPGLTSAMARAQDVALLLPIAAATAVVFTVYFRFVASVFVAGKPRDEES